MFNQDRIAKILGIFSYIFLMLNIFLLPLLLDKNLSNIYIIPKQYAFGGLVLINLLLWLAQFVLTKRFIFTKTILDKPLLAVGFLSLISAIFSVNIYDSFFGRAEYFTVNFSILILFIVFYYLIINFVKNVQRWRGMLDVLMLSGFVSLVVFVLKNIFKLNFLNYYLGSSWNTLDSINSIFGVWAVIILILSFGQLLKKETSKLRTVAYLINGLLSFAVLVMLSFSVLWWVLLASLVLLLLLGVSFVKNIRVWWVSTLFAFLICTIILIIFGTPKFVQVAAPTEVALGFAPSYVITKGTIFSGVKEFFIGSGLGSFGVDFSKFRSVSFNVDPVAWSLRFNQPFSTFFTLISEGGVLLLLSFVFIILVLYGHIYQMWKNVRTNTTSLSELVFNRDSVLFESILLSFVFILLTGVMGVAFYSQILWLVWWMLLAMIVAGFSFYSTDFVKTKEWTIEDTPQYSLAFSFGLIVTMTAVVMVCVFGVRLYLGEVAYNKAVASTNSQDAEMYINDAISKRSNYDVYHAALAQIYLNQAVEKSKQASPDVQAISSVMAKAVNEAKFAADLSPQSVVLWENLATMYENAATLVPDARSWAIKSLEKAQELEPTNPTHPWRLGNSYTALAKWEEAEKYYKKAIELKADYFGAHIGLSNVYEQTQKIDQAITVYEDLVKQNQTSPEVLYNYGRLLYNRNVKNDRTQAETIWQKVVQMQPNYSNALYSLGLLYETRGDKNTALQYYEMVGRLNPNNKTIQNKIQDLRGASVPVVE